MESLTVCRRVNVPAFFQSLANFSLREFFLLRPIFIFAVGVLRQVFARVAWLTIFRHKLRRFYVFRFPIEVKDLVLGSQIIFGVAMAFQTPSHAVWLSHIHYRHVIDRTVTTETTDAAVHVRGVIVINVIDRAVDPHPVDRVAAVPALSHRLQFWVVLLNLSVAVHAGLGVGHVRLRRHLHEAVTIPAIHPQLRDVNVMRERNRLDRLITDLGIFRRGVIPRGARQSTHHHDAADQDFDRHPIRPAWKEIRHGYLSAAAPGTRGSARCP